MIVSILLTEDLDAETVDGQTVFSAIAQVQPSGREIVAIALPQARGIWWPYKAGEMCLAALDGGSAYILGAYLNAGDGAGDGNTYLGPSSGVVRLGARDSGWDGIMLYSRAKTAIDTMKDALSDALQVVATHVTSPSHSPDPAGATRLLVAKGKVDALLNVSAARGLEASDGDA